LSRCLVDPDLTSKSSWRPNIVCAITFDPTAVSPSAVFPVDVFQVMTP
jgi:hypothetical protein